MMKFKELYRKNIYGVMGALIFHILLFVALWITELDLTNQPKDEEAILLDFTLPDKISELSVLDKNKEEKSENDQQNNGSQASVSNRAVNDAAPKDKYFDKSYNQDIEDARKLVADVISQLSKKASTIKKYEMPEATTEGQDRDSIKNVIYSGKSNIHYFLENRFHVRLPIPVYLAKGGGQIIVDIQVDRNGNVIKTLVRSSGKLTDPLLPQYAVEAAERTVFNHDSKAPSIQKGTITYNFVPQ